MTRTVSLRRRVVATTVAVTAGLLLVVGVFVDVGLGARLRSDAAQRLAGLADLAVQLDGTVDDRTLVDRLAATGARAELRDGDSVVVPAPPLDPPGPAGGPGGGPAATGGPADPGAAGAVAEDAGSLTLERPLAGGRTLTLSTSLAPVRDALRGFRVLMVAGSAAGLALAGLASWLLLGRALRPLDAMTATARSIAAGDRGRRLAPTRTDTELGRTAEAFDTMLDSLEGAERRATGARDALQQFLSDAAHELRTPLAGVVAGAEALLLDTAHGTAPDDGRARREESAVRTVREARRAGRLVADLLAVSRLHEVRPDVAVVDAGAVLRAAAAGLADLPGPAAGHVEVVVPPGLAPVLADPEHVRRVLDNLLDNARRAAPGGGVRAELDAAAPGRVRAWVSDTGPGVPAADRERVFERLVRLDPARASDGGSGLGLAIARGLAAAAGGTLRCVDPGGDVPAGTLPGAVFVLDLPAA